MNRPLLAFAGLIAAGGTAAGVYVAVPDGGDEEVVQQVATATPSLTGPATQAPTPAVTSSPSASAIPADWLSYSDSVLALSLRYPPDLELTDSGLIRGQRSLRFRSPSDPSRTLVIAMVENVNSLTLEQWVVERTACIAKTIERGTVAGNDAIFCTAEPAGIPEATLLFESMGTIFHFSSIMPSSEFELVIASFQL